MKRQSRIGRALAQIAVIVFFSNATYGACCFASPATGEGEGPVMEMPCLQTDGKNASSSNSDNCCLMCVPMMTSLDVKVSLLSAMEAPGIRVVPVLTTGGVDPPFRPPIPILS